MEDGENRVYVERFEGSGVGEGGLFVSYVEGAVVEPDIGFGGDGAYGEGGVEGDVSPVIIM